MARFLWTIDNINSYIKKHKLRTRNDLLRHNRSLYNKVSKRKLFDEVNLIKDSELRKRNETGLPIGNQELYGEL